jgi:hypothetical protein
MRLLVAFHQEGQQFDHFGFRGRGFFQSGQLEKSLCLDRKLLIIVNDTGSALRDHFCRVGQNFLHFAPLPLS